MTKSEKTGKTRKTGKVGNRRTQFTFKDRAPVPASWYVADAQGWAGPYEIAELLVLFERGSRSWTDSVWDRAGRVTEWTRACDHEALRTHFPKAPPAVFLAQISASPLPGAENGEEGPAPGEDPYPVLPTYELDGDSLPSMRILRPAEPPPEPLPPRDPTVHLDTPRGPIPSRAEVKPAHRRAGAPKASAWFLHFDGSEFGPLSEDELAVILRSGKLKGNLFAWREGRPKWTPIAEIPELLHLLAATGFAPANPNAREHRRNQRVPLVATVRVTPETPVPQSGPVRPILGICRDISVGGMLVSSSGKPGPAGTRVKLEISPMGYANAAPFTVDGRVVRQTEKGFSIQFEAAGDEVKKALRKFLEAAK